MLLITRSLRCVAFFAMILLLAVGGAGTVKADSGLLGFEASLTSGTTSNLLRNTSGRGDSYSTASLTGKFYPHSGVEISGVGEYTYYGHLFQLSNLRYGAGLTVIPTGENSPFTLYLTGHYFGRSYRDDDYEANTNDFSAKDYDAQISLGYELAPRVHIRSGVSVTVTGYDLEDVSDKKTYEFFGGFNTTPFGRNSVDLELGYTTGNYDFVDIATGGIRRDKAYTLQDEGDLNSFYVSARFSRPIGFKSAVSIVLSHREFTDFNEDAVVYGYTTGLLSPWASTHDGDAATVSIKSFLLPRLITTLSAGYWDKAFLQTVEGREDTFIGGTVISTLFAEPRADDLRRVSLNLQLPIPSHSGMFYEPSIQIAYSSNSSSIEVYRYTDFSISGGISMRF